MRLKNFMSYEDAEEVLGEYAGEINQLKNGLTNYQTQNDLNLEVPNRKNLLPMKVSTIKSINTSGTWLGDTYTLNGMTFTITGDAEDNLTSITLNGKATANCYFMLNNVVVFDVDSFNSYTPSNKYKAITGTGSGGDVNSYSVVYQASNHETYIRVAANYTSDNITLAPMITELWVTDTTFAPYIPSVDARLDAVESGCVKVVATTNLNECTELGIYTYPYTAQNVPSQHSGSVLVLSNTTAFGGVQIARGNQDNNVYVRFFDDGVFTQWQSMTLGS